MRRHLNLILLLLVVLLLAAPLMLVRKSSRGQDGAIFTGTDTQACDAIASIAPEYRPWVKPLMVPPSSGVESLLFALQAAIGAGFIGYYFGVQRTRSKYEKAKGSTPC